MKIRKLSQKYSTYETKFYETLSLKNSYETVVIIVTRASFLVMQIYLKL